MNVPNTPAQEQEDSKLGFIQERELYRRYPERCVYVASIPNDVTSERIKGFFEVCGPVESVVMPQHKLNVRLQRFGFIRFKSASAAKKAREELNDRVFDGRVIKVDRYTPTSMRFNETADK